MYKSKIEEDLKRVVTKLGALKVDILVSIPEKAEFGDYTSNVALQLSKQKLNQDYHSPKEIANAILESFGHPDYLERVEVVGPGFMNFFLKDEVLVSETSVEITPKTLGKTPKRYLVEFAHPNTHKAFHIGHLRNISTGESISRLLEFNGNEVYRVTYGGDIGPHVAKAIWGILQLRDEFEDAKNGSLREKAEFLGKAYAYGSQKYEETEQNTAKIDEINQKLYQGSEDYKSLWEETKQWSIAYFDSIYSRVGTEFETEIWESEIQELGSLIVEENLGTVFVKDEGAIIFPGEKYGLHNRVFITKAGYPTYEGKEMGLTRRETELFPYDKSLHIVANEQESFFQVTTKAIELIDPLLKGKKEHISYGMVNLSTGKMSSRKGEVVTAENLIEEVKEIVKSNYQTSNKLSESELDKLAIAAIKFYFLKYSIASNIAYDVEKSVSLQGDSGPYLLYTYARTQSILNRAKEFKAKSASSLVQDSKIAQSTSKVSMRNKSSYYAIASKVGNAGMIVLEAEEREVLRQLEYFELVVESAASKFQPNELANYLLNLARSFSLFYERHPVLGSPQEDFRLQLVKKVGETLKIGLYLLGIEVLERM